MILFECVLTMNVYADDTVLVYVGTSLEMLTEHVNSRLREIFEWCNCNILSLNPAKSEFLTVTNKIAVNFSKLFIGTDPFMEVDSFKYLGIHVYAGLKFNVQINHLKGKLSKLGGIFV